MSDFRVDGADQFLALSKALKAAGRTELRRELNNGMKRAARPLVKVAKDAARNTFPSSGGLAAREAKIPFRPQTRTGRDPGVSIVAPGKYVVGKTTNANGTFRHPVFASGDQTRREWTWVTQRLGNQGWFDEAMTGAAPMVVRELEQALQNIADQVVRGAGRG